MANQLPPTLKLAHGTPLPGVTLAASPYAKYLYRLKYTEGASTVKTIAYARSGKQYYSLDINAGTNTTAGRYGLINVQRLTFGRWQMPTALTRPLQTGTAIAMGGDRLFAAELNGSGTNAKVTKIAFSEKGMPNRFAHAATIIDGQVQPNSAGLSDFGSEIITAITPESSGIRAGDGMIAWTNAAVYLLSGIDAIQLSRPANIGPYGTLSPGSIARYKNAVVWVTPERELRTLGNEIGDISSRMVEDVLYAIPASRIPYIESAIYRDRLYVGYTPSGGTKNTNALVFDARTQGWSIDNISTLSGATFCKWATTVVSNETRLLCFDTTGWMFDYNSTVTTGDRYVTATTTTQPRIQLTSRTLSNTFLEQFRLGDIMIVADSQGAGVVWDASLIDRRTGLTTAGKINMYDSNAYKVWKYGRGTTEDLRIGLASLGVQVDIQGPGIPNSAIYAISVDEEEQTPHGATRD
jgi:hypothetical protein